MYLLFRYFVLLVVVVAVAIIVVGSDGDGKLVRVNRSFVAFIFPYFFLRI